MFLAGRPTIVIMILNKYIFLVRSIQNTSLYNGSCVPVLQRHAITLKSRDGYHTYHAPQKLVISLHPCFLCGLGKLDSKQDKALSAHTLISLLAKWCSIDAKVHTQVQIQSVSQLGRTGALFTQ